MGQTRYSRDTWNKKQLRESLNTPRYGDYACALCEDGDVPYDMSYQVSEYKNCGDIHLQLSLIKPNDMSCATGQEKYREMCCEEPPMEEVVKRIEPAAAVAVGLLLFAALIRKIRNRRRHQIANADDHDPTVELSSSESYKRMKDNPKVSKKRSTSRSKSRKETHAQQPLSKSASLSKNRSSKHSQQLLSKSSSMSKKRSKGRETTPRRDHSRGRATENQDTYELHPHYIPPAPEFHPHYVPPAPAPPQEFYHLNDDTVISDTVMCYDNDDGVETVADGTVAAVITQVV